MKETVILNQLFYQGVNTLISAIVLVLLSAIIFFIINKRVKNIKQARKIRSRIIYVASVIFLLALIRIWIEGFTHIFTMLSLVAAGLVVTNKENIMNLTGWAIITWRELFSEGDAIQVQNYIGFVTTTKLLYFTIAETVELGHSQLTGKTIKIPNGLIITNPIIKFDGDDNFILHKIPYVVNVDDSPINIGNKAKLLILELIKNKYQFNKEFTESTSISKRKLSISGIAEFEPQIELKFFCDKEKLVNVQTNFYCYPQDAKNIEQEYMRALLTHVSEKK